MDQLLYDGWRPLVRTAIIAVLAYASLVALLRFSGRRTLSKMNAFDLVITVSLGSTLATILLSKDVSLAQGVLSLALLIGMQFIVTWSSVRAGWVRRLVTGEPALLLYQGVFLQASLRRARVTEDEVRAAVRSAGVARLDDVGAVVLETDGSFSIVGGDVAAENASLKGVEPAQSS